MALTTKMAAMVPIAAVVVHSRIPPEMAIACQAYFFKFRCHMLLSREKKRYFEEVMMKLPPYDKLRLEQLQRQLANYTTNVMKRKRIAENNY